MNKAEEVILTLNIFIEDVLNVYPNLKRRYSFGRCYIIGSCALILQGVSERKTDDIDIYFHGKRKSFNNFYNKVSPIAINYNIDLLNKVSSDNYVVDKTTLTDCLIENFSSKGFPLKILKPEAIYLMKLSLQLLIDLMNPYNLPRFQKTWTKLDGGYLLSEPHVIDAPSGVLRGRPATFIDIEAGRVVLANEDALSNNDIRLYTALEIRTMLTETGFKNIEFYGQNKLPRMPYTSTSGRMVVVATK